MSVCNFPIHSVVVPVKAPNEAILPACDDWVIVKSNTTTWAAVLLASVASECRFVFREVPDLDWTVFINADELVWSLWAEMKVDDATSMSISMKQERQIISKNSI
jgi:hypothetical protein